MLAKGAPDIDGLVQERRNFIANALELRLSWNNPLIQCMLTYVIHSSPKVMAVFLFLIFENFLIGGMFSILETIKSDRSTLILQNNNWCQTINPMCTTFQMWQNCILQNQVCFERLISLSKTPYIFVKISKPRNCDPYSISAMSHGNRTSSYETVAHKLRPSVAFDWQYAPRQKLWPFPQT